MAVRLLHLLPSFAVSFLAFFYVPNGALQLVEIAEADESAASYERTTNPDTALRVPELPPKTRHSEGLPKVTPHDKLAGPTRFVVYGDVRVSSYSNQVALYLEGIFGAIVMVL